MPQPQEPDPQEPELQPPPERRDRAGQGQVGQGRVHRPALLGQRFEPGGFDFTTASTAT